MIRVLCPHCDRRYRTEREAFGRTVICTHCRESFKLGEKLAPFEWKPKDIVEDSWIGVEPPEEKAELKHCFKCDAPLPPDVITCPACGANQITGVVRRAKAEPKSEGRSIGTVLPLRLILVLTVLAAIAAGGYWAIMLIAHSARTVTDELVDQGTVAKAAKYLRDGGDEYGLEDRYAGQVTDQNLARYVKMLGGADAGIRKAAALLIGAGNIENIQPVIAAAQDAEYPEEVTRALHAIGAKRLVGMASKGPDESRRTAAEALCLINGLSVTPDNLAQLSEAMPEAEKIQRLNGMTRPWPEAVGAFAVVIREITADFTVSIEQVGRTFYLRVGPSTFHTGWSPAEKPLPLPRFSIPTSRWALATGASYDLLSLEEMFGGTVALTSPTGFGWEGTVRVQARQDLPSKPPGFLPVPTPGRTEVASAPIRLQRQ